MSNGFTGNGELEQVTGDKLPVKQLPIEEVDSLADELVREYNNPIFRVWYCGVIYQFGLEQVAEWQRKAASGTNPGGLFGYYVKQARASANSNTGKQPEQPTDTEVLPDKVHIPTDYELDHIEETVSRNIDQTLLTMEQPVDMSAWDNATGSGTDASLAPSKAIPWMHEDDGDEAK